MLERIEARTFGKCEDCGCEIPKERLDSVPYTRWCIDCAEPCQRVGRGQEVRQTLVHQFAHGLFDQHVQQRVGGLRLV